MSDTIYVQAYVRWIDFPEYSTLTERYLNINVTEFVSIYR